MRSTSSSAQHFKSTTEPFLESCHLFTTVLIADQGLDRADICPSAAAAPPQRMRSLLPPAFQEKRRDWDGKPSWRAGLLVLGLPSLSPRIVCSCRCVVQEAKPLSGWLCKSAHRHLKR